jgi:hypothetical protein
MISNYKIIEDLTRAVMIKERPYEESNTIAGLVTNWLAIAIFTEEGVVKWCTAGFARMCKKSISEVQGKQFIDIDPILLKCAADVADNILIPVAREEGYSVGTYWFEDPTTRNLSRCALAFMSLPNGDLGVTALMLDDATSGFFTRRVDDGFEDREGNVYSVQELEIIDLFLAGHSYECMAQQLKSTAPIMRRRLNKLARRMNVETPAGIRGIIWGRAAEDVLISPSSILRGHHYSFPKT